MRNGKTFTFKQGEMLPARQAIVDRLTDSEQLQAPSLTSP
jgi:hypothetical protein